MEGLIKSDIHGIPFLYLTASDIRIELEHVHLGQAIMVLVIARLRVFLPCNYCKVSIITYSKTYVSNLPNLTDWAIDTHGSPSAGFMKLVSSAYIFISGKAGERHLFTRRGWRHSIRSVSRNDRGYAWQVPSTYVSLVFFLMWPGIT